VKSFIVQAPELNKDSTSPGKKLNYFDNILFNCHLDSWVQTFDEASASILLPALLCHSGANVVKLSAV
jgi:hypothetical protein